MQNFLILIREDIARVKEMSEEAMQAEIQQYTRWVEKLAETNNFVSGDPLENYGNWMTSESVRSDGPFMESKEVITGYIMMQAENLDHATELAKTCPIFETGGMLEVRPIMKF